LHAGSGQKQYKQTSVTNSIDVLADRRAAVKLQVNKRMKSLQISRGLRTSVGLLDLDIDIRLFTANLISLAISIKKKLFPLDSSLTESSHLIGEDNG
jgi:hypothetical protein